MLKSALLKLLTLKAGAVAVLAVGAGGVALAASTDVIPNPLHPHGSPSAPGPSHDPGRSGPDDDGKTPSPSMVGLCTAFNAGAGADHGKALDSPAFQALIAAAGGKDQVESFCTNVLATAPGHPTTHPSGEADSHESPHPSKPPLPTGTPTHPGP